MKEINPFTISVCKNENMGAFDLCLQVGGFKTKEGAEHFAKVLAEFMKDDNATAWAERVQ